MTVSPSVPPAALLADASVPRERAQALAERLHLPLATTPPPAGVLLRLTPAHVELSLPGDPEFPAPLLVDFDRVLRRARHAGSELLVRACKVRHTRRPLVIDATAGLGRDGFLLAAAGFRVRMIEAHPLIATLLQDGLKRAAASPHLAMIAERVELSCGNALDLLPTLNEQPDVIYLDPMFPERKKSAKVKQELRLLQKIVGNPVPPEQVLRRALELCPRKVVLKQPRYGAPLDLAPSYSLHGKAVRFDIFLGAEKKNA
ncbi:MAG: class I SAM-dependent methyltransferase [Desulfobulbus sp.]